MKRENIVAAAFLLAVAPAVAHAQTTPSYHSEKTVDADGKGDYSSSTETKGTDAAGTKRTLNESTKAKTTWTGKRKYEATASSTTDPKGTGNKQSGNEKTTVTTDKNGSMHKHVKNSSVDANGTAVSDDTTVDTKTQADGTPKVTTETTHTEDPKGLMNKKTTKTKGSTE